MPASPGRRKKTGVDKGRRVLIYLTTARRAILGRINPALAKAMYQLIDAFDAAPLPKPLGPQGATIALSEATDTAQPKEPAPAIPKPPAKPKFKNLCLRCSRCGAPSCPDCRTANGLPP